MEIEVKEVSKTLIIILASCGVAVLFLSFLIIGPILWRKYVSKKDKGEKMTKV